MSLLKNSLKQRQWLVRDSERFLNSMSPSRRKIFPRKSQWFDTLCRRGESPKNLDGARLHLFIRNLANAHHAIYGAKWDVVVIVLYRNSKAMQECQKRSTTLVFSMITLSRPYHPCTSQLPMQKDGNIMFCLQFLSKRNCVWQHRPRHDHYCTHSAWFHVDAITTS